MITDAPPLQRTEAAPTLVEPPPRALRRIDQLGLWGNLGVSLLTFTGAAFVLVPVSTPLSLGAALLAVLVGTILGALGLAAAAVPGAATGAPAMVLLRGLLGTKASYVPTVLNIAQLVGWTTFELVIISDAMRRVSDSLPRWSYVLIAGVITTVLALRPLGWIRVLRKYVTIAVLVAMTYLLIQLLRHPLPGFGDGSWHEFWLAVDIVISIGVSWVPLAADYSRHARSTKDAFVGAFAGYSVTQIFCYALGLIALVTVARDDSDVFGAFIAVPVGTLAFAVIAIRELDQTFADTYSTAVSVQNFRPRWDRRVLALVVGGVATAGALILNVHDYQNFLYLLGSVFVPLLGVIVVDWFVISRGNWRLDERAPARWTTLLAWGLGFAAYQLINPGLVSWWASWWHHVQDWINFTPKDWMSASIGSFLVAALTTLALGLVARTTTRTTTRTRTRTREG